MITVGIQESNISLIMSLIFLSHPTAVCSEVSASKTLNCLKLIVYSSNYLTKKATSVFIMQHILLHKRGNNSETVMHD